MTNAGSRHCYVDASFVVQQNRQASISPEWVDDSRASKSVNYHSGSVL